MPKRGRSFGRYTHLLSLRGDPSAAPVTDAAGRQVVKVQLGINDAGASCVVYNADRSFVYHGTTPDELLALMGRRQKVFFWAKIITQGKRRTFSIEEEAPSQNW